MQRKSTIYGVCALAILLVAGCGKKPAPKVPPAPPPPPPAPTASLSANPSSVQRGQPVQLTWSTTNATDVTIEGVGPVNASGSQSVTPQESTTYRLLAHGPGGTQDATARVTVEGPPPPPVQQSVDTSTDEQWLTKNVQDVFFDYDSAELSPEAHRTVTTNAQALNQRSTLRVTIEGHCDERGSTEYNLALGDRRAGAVREALTAAGVNASRLNTISYGKEKPQCTESSEACWQRNRRAHTTLSK